MNQSIVKPKFGYINNNTKIYLITKKNIKHPLCFGKCEFYTVPVLLKHNIQYNNTIIGYTKRAYIDKSILENNPEAEVELYTCKDMMNLAQTLSMPACIIIEKQDNSCTIFYRPIRKMS